MILCKYVCSVRRQHKFIFCWFCGSCEWKGFSIFVRFLESSGWTMSLKNTYHWTRPMNCSPEQKSRHDGMCCKWYFQLPGQAEIIWISSFSPVRATCIHMSCNLEAKNKCRSRYLYNVCPSSCYMIPAAESYLRSVLSIMHDDYYIT